MKFDIVEFLRGLRNLGLKPTRLDVRKKEHEFFLQKFEDALASFMETHQQRQRKAENKVTQNRHLKLIRMIHNSEKVEAERVSVINPATMENILIAVVNALREHELQLDELKDPSMKTRGALRLQIAHGTGEEAMAAFEELMKRNMSAYPSQGGGSLDVVA